MARRPVHTACARCRLRFSSISTGCCTCSASDLSPTVDLRRCGANHGSPTRCARCWRPASPAMFVALELCERAFRFLSERDAASEDDLLSHVFGGHPPAALGPRLVEPLLADPRLIRRPDGSWTLKARVELGSR